MVISCHSEAVPKNLNVQRFLDSSTLLGIINRIKSTVRSFAGHMSAQDDSLAKRLQKDDSIRFTSKGTAP